MDTIYNKMTMVADAIREKTGKTSKLTLDKMASDLNLIKENDQTNLDISDELVVIPAGNYKEPISVSTLNFNIVGGTTQPSNPSKNLIWVNTSTEISGWSFSNTPNPTFQGKSGWLYICAKTNSNISTPPNFNALKKNEIILTPMSVKQYVNGAWKSVSAKTYTGTSWKSWYTYLYNQGDKCLNVIGDWVSEDVPFNASASSGLDRAYKPTYYDTYMELNGYGGAWSGIMRTSNKIDLTGYTTLKFKGTFPTLHIYENCIYVWTAIGSNAQQNLVASYSGLTSTDGVVYEISIDVSNVNQPCYIGFAGYGNGPITVEQFWLE